MLPFLKADDYRNVNVVGIPRGLLYYRYSTLWRTFFEEIGRTVVESEETDKAVLAAGEARSVDECCLASKIYLGHVEALRGRCDAVFVPGFSNVGRHASFCTKFQAMPDLVANTFADDQLRVISLYVDELGEKTDHKAALLRLAQRFGAYPKEAKAAVKRAFKAQREHDAQAAARFERQLAEAKAAAQDARSPLSILLLAHPYVAHDRHIGGDVVRMLEGLGARVLLADEADRTASFKRSFEFSETMPWLANRELIGALLGALDAVDGVVLVSAFPCGPDSMTNDAILRCVQGKPMLTLTVDAQAGTAGLETRVESFVDILAYQRKGGYLSHG